MLAKRYLDRMGNYNEVAKKIISTGASTITIDSLQNTYRPGHGHTWWNSDDIRKLYPYMDTFVIYNGFNNNNVSVIQFSLTSAVIVMDRDYNYEMLDKALTRRHKLFFLTSAVSELTNDLLSIDVSYPGGGHRVYMPQEK